MPARGTVVTTPPRRNYTRGSLSPAVYPAGDKATNRRPEPMNAPGRLGLVQWSPRRGRTALVAAAAVLLGIAAVVVGDWPGRILLGIASLGLAVDAVHDLVARPRLAAGPDGVVVRGWAEPAGCPGRGCARRYGRRGAWGCSRAPWRSTSSRPRRGRLPGGARPPRPRRARGGGPASATGDEPGASARGTTRSPLDPG